MSKQFCTFVSRQAAELSEGLGGSATQQAVVHAFLQDYDRVQYNITFSFFGGGGGGEGYGDKDWMVRHLHGEFHYFNFFSSINVFLFDSNTPKPLHVGAT